jgi:hypothetical protein
MTIFAFLSYAAIIAIIILAVVIWKMVHELIVLTNSIKRWVEIYFPPHLNAAADNTSSTSGTKVTINPQWSEDELPRD